MKIPIWVFGFKKDMPVDDWYRDISYIILGYFDKISKRDKTILSEAGLGIEPSWYSYICRAEILYGNGIFFFEVETDEWGAKDRGICPFDTGGLWCGNIKTTPELITDQDKITFFEKHDSELNNWSTFFYDYIKNNYTDISEYIMGSPPDLGTGIEEIIKENPPNIDIAWTWEGRVPRSKIKSKTKLIRFYCSNDKLIHMIRSISSFLFLTLKEKEILIKWLKTSTIVCKLPKSATSTATDDLIKRGL